MDSAQFHFLASVFGVLVAFRNHEPLSQIRQLRDEGCSLAKIADCSGTTVSFVRRLVGKVDREARRQRQDEIAQQIDQQFLSWPEKVERWKEQTGQCGVTLWRVLKRSGK